VPDLSRLKSNKFVCYVGFNNFIIKIISSLLLLQGGTREVSILPLSPLRIPPNPLKRLLKRRRGYACLRQALIADRVEDETMLCVQQSMISNPAKERTHLLLAVCIMPICTEVGKNDAECSNRTQNVSFWVVTRSCTKVLRG
jgi:hypothetical protein